MSTHIKLIALFLSLGATLMGCLPAISTSFESARMLEPKAVEVQGNASIYYGFLSESQVEEWGFRTQNYGISAAYGISSKLRVKARFEQIILIDRAELVDSPLLEPGTRVTYSEISLKYGWKQKRRNLYGAISLPIGLFSYPRSNTIYLSPTSHATYSKNNKFEIGMNGKLHFWLNGEPPIPWISIGLGLGFSKNLNRWAVRPEIGYDLYNVSAGIGFSYIFSTPTTRKNNG